MHSSCPLPPTATVAARESRVTRVETKAAPAAAAACVGIGEELSCARAGLCHHRRQQWLHVCGNRETDRQTDTDRQKQRQKQRDKERRRETETERDRDKERKTERDRERQRDRRLLRRCRRWRLPVSVSVSAGSSVALEPSSATDGNSGCTRVARQQTAVAGCGGGGGGCSGRLCQCLCQ